MFTPENNRSGADPHHEEDTTLSRRERDFARHRRELVEAATELFMSEGVAQTTMRQIAAKVGVSVGAIYQHFPSKDDLLQAVITKLVKVYDRIRKEILAEDVERPMVVLRRSMKEFIGYFERNPMLLDLILSVEASQLPNVCEAKDRYHQSDIALFREAMDRGHIRRVDPAIATAVFDGAAMGLLRYLSGTGQRERLGEIPDLIDALLLEPLLISKTSPKKGTSGI